MLPKTILPKAMLLPLFACAVAVPAAHAQPDKVEWAELSLDEALAEAKETGEILMIDVAAGHCGACGDMDRELWDSPEGAAFVEGMIPIRFDSTTPAGKALGRRYPVTGLPLVIFIRPDGQEIDRITGYTSSRDFLRDAEPLKQGVDPLPMMEEQLAAHPDSVTLYLPVMERYLNRLRREEADSLLSRILILDPENRYRQAERALRSLAKHARIVEEDMPRALALWKRILDQFPGCSTTSAAVQGSYRAASALGERADWQDWICGHVESESTNANLQYSIAMIARRYRMRGPCFAKAARTARSLGKGGPFLDTLAVELEGGVGR